MSDNQLPQIAYIFGAGASAQVLPTIKGLPDRIKAVREVIEKEFQYEEDEKWSPKPGVELLRNEAKAYLLEGMDRLHKVSSDHSTIDTYAKKLYLNSSSNEITELVFFLALYFNIEQKLVGVDPRYDTFLISILDSDTYRFPGNLKFLTWNYDSQMEIAHNHLSGLNRADFSTRLFDTDLSRVKKDEFISVKINGTCDFKGNFREAYPLISNLLTPGFAPSDLDFAMSYSTLQLKKRQRIYDGHVGINFAWFKDHDRLNQIAEFYDQTEILVVIGYSFPFFNREIDRKIIRCMGKLKKIYIQDCYPENIKSRFLSILPDWQERKIEIIAINDVTEFFLPPEL